MEIGAVVLVAIGVIVAGIGLMLVPRPVSTVTAEPGVAARPARSSMAVTACGAIAIVCALVGLILRVAD